MEVALDADIFTTGDEWSFDDIKTWSFWKQGVGMRQDSLETKISVYIAIVIPTLLYVSKS